MDESQLVETTKKDLFSIDPRMIQPRNGLNVRKEMTKKEFNALKIDIFIDCLKKS